MKKIIFCAALVALGAFSTSAVAGGGKWNLAGAHVVQHGGSGPDMYQCTYTKRGRVLRLNLYTWSGYWGCGYQVGFNTTGPLLRRMGAY